MKTFITALLSMILLLNSCDRTNKPLVTDIKQNYVDSFELIISVEPSFHNGYFIIIQSQKGNNFLKILPLDPLGNYYGKFDALIVPIPNEKMSKFINDLKKIDFSKLELKDIVMVDGTVGLCQIYFNNSLAKEFTWNGDYEDQEIIKAIFMFTKQFVYTNPHLKLLDDIMSVFDFLPDYSINDLGTKYISIFGLDSLELLNSQLMQMNKNEEVIFNLSNINIINWENEDMELEMLSNILNHFDNSWFLVEPAKFHFDSTKLEDSYDDYYTEGYKAISSEIINRINKPNRIFSNYYDLCLEMYRKQNKMKPFNIARKGTPVPVP